MCADADVCMAPARWEGLGLHLYEAIAFDIVKARRFNGGKDTKDVKAGLAYDLQFENWPD